MARSDLFLEAFISYYGKLGMDAVALMRTTREEMRNDSWDCKKTASRTALWWSDACEGLWSAMLTSGTPPLPILLIATPADSGSDSGSVRVNVQGTKNPEMTSLSRVGTGEVLEATVEVANLRNEITVNLPALQDPRPGTYQAVIYLDRLAIAQVVVEILPSRGNRPAFGAVGNGGGGGNRNRLFRPAKKKRRPPKKAK